MENRVLEARENNIHLSPKQQVEAKNGLAYEVIINEAKCATPTRLTPQSNRIFTQDEIRAKLLKAEERRHSIEVSKLQVLAEKTQKIEEAAKVREEAEQEFSKKTEQKLQVKIQTNKENREALIAGLLDRLRKTDSKINQIKEINAQETRELENKISNKLNVAEENRLDQINSVVDRMKEHEKHVEEVRKALSSEKEDLSEKILQRLENACVFREKQIEKMKEKLREHDKHCEQVRGRAKSPNQSLEQCGEQ
jgi:hypothetical protein